MKCRVLNETGIECPSCGRETQVRTHKAIKPKQLRQPYYFTKWFYCRNTDCKVKTIMRDEFKVMNRNDASRKLQNAIEYQQKLNHLRSI